MNHFRIASAALVATTLVALPKLALAEDSGGQVAQGYATAPTVQQMSISGVHGIFGTKGHITISNDVGMQINYTHISGDVSSNSFKFLLRPAVDYFIIDNLSLGAYMVIDYTHFTNGHTLNFAIGGRAGYNIWLLDRVSIWARGGLAYALNKNASSGGGVDFSSSASALSLNLSAPFLYHGDNVFIGFGPALDVDLTGNNRATTIAGYITLGGSF